MEDEEKDEDEGNDLHVIWDQIRQMHNQIGKLGGVAEDLKNELKYSAENL